MPRDYQHLSKETVNLLVDITCLDYCIVPYSLRYSLHHTFKNMSKDSATKAKRCFRKLKRKMAKRLGKPYREMNSSNLTQRVFEKIAYESINKIPKG